MSLADLLLLLLSDPYQVSFLLGLYLIRINYFFSSLTTINMYAVCCMCYIAVNPYVQFARLSYR